MTGEWLISAQSDDQALVELQALLHGPQRRCRSRRLVRDRMMTGIGWQLAGLRRFGEVRDDPAAQEFVHEQWSKEDLLRAMAAAMSQDAAALMMAADRCAPGRNASYVANSDASACQIGVRAAVDK